MRWLRWMVWLVLLGVVGAFLHYTLPQHDVVRIVGTQTQRMDLGWNGWFYAASDAGTQKLPGRDVKFIQTIQRDGAPMVFRNEDTGWSWPPYLKFNSFNLQTRADDLISNSEAPKWVVVTHYGWRNEALTIFPNALTLKAVADPDVTLIPWASIVVFVLLAVALLLAVRTWRRLTQRRSRRRF